MLVYGKNVAIEILKGNYKINKVFLDNNYKDEEILSLIDKKNLKKFEETGNTEYLVDVANYAMFRYMYPQGKEYYQATDSKDSAGIDGICIKEIQEV